MKTCLSFLTAIMLVCLAGLVFGQDVVEIQKPVASTAYLEVQQKIDALGDQDRDKKIDDSDLRVARNRKSFRAIWDNVPGIIVSVRRKRSVPGLL